MIPCQVWVLSRNSSNSLWGTNHKKNTSSNTISFKECNIDQGAIWHSLWKWYSCAMELRHYCLCQWVETRVWALNKSMGLQLQIKMEQGAWLKVVAYMLQINTRRTILWIFFTITRYWNFFPQITMFQKTPQGGAKWDGACTGPFALGAISLGAWTIF